MRFDPDECAAIIVRHMEKELGVDQGSIGSPRFFIEAAQFVGVDVFVDTGGTGSPYRDKGRKS